jgi:succinate dehydrogenase/fumarate reductase cytochrome b subunit (b558 family)
MDEESPNDARDAHDAHDAHDDQRKPTTDRWRRRHQLSGAGFLALFLCVHLGTNASVLAGEGAYARVVVALERSRLFPLIELFILVPLAVHVVYGIVLLRRRATPDALVDRYGDRRLWVLQRVAAVVLLVFLVVHLVEIRLQKLAFGLEPDALYTLLSAHLSWTWAGVPWMALLYLLGLAAAALHLGNGLFATTASWRAGGSAKRTRVVTVALGTLLFVVGAATVVGFATGTRLFPATEDDGPCGSAAPDPLTPSAKASR